MIMKKRLIEGLALLYLGRETEDENKCHSKDKEAVKKFFRLKLVVRQRRKVYLAFFCRAVFSFFRISHFFLYKRNWILATPWLLVRMLLLDLFDPARSIAFPV